MTYKISKILGISFINEKPITVIQALLNEGGLLTVPSGPGLASIPDDAVYYNSLLNSDFVLADSGLMALIWNKISNEKIIRTSGLGFINQFVSTYPNSDLTKKVFLVNPNEDEQQANLKYFNSVSVPVSEELCYIAPFYKKDKIEDIELLKKLNNLRPHWVFLNIGGGTQEILGYWLRKNLDYKPAIICTGAAIAFKTGRQVQIPAFIDQIYMGWLWRVISNPKVYGKRFWEARRTASLVWKHKDKQVYEIPANVA